MIYLVTVKQPRVVRSRLFLVTFYRWRHDMPLQEGRGPAQSLTMHRRGPGGQKWSNGGWARRQIRYCPEPTVTWAE